MKYLVTAEEMKQYDSYTIENIGIPSLVLMERAAMATVDELKQQYLNKADKTGIPIRILVIAGTGNNGGDGFAIGRLLEEEGYTVTYVLAGNRKKCSPETERQIAIIEEYGHEILYHFPKEEYTIIIDALFGIGLCREVTGIQKEMMDEMNRSSAYKVAVDIPSGVNADTGAIMGTALKADLTVTFAYAKRGLYLYPGTDYAGKIVCRQIGITERSMCGKRPEMFTYEEAATKLMPPRKPNGNKGTFGKVLVIAGSKNMCGAAILCGESAYRTGAGMVKIVTAEENREVIHTALPEALLMTYTEGGQWKEELLESMAWADCIAIGPGMGTTENGTEIMEAVIQNGKVPLIVDADALNLLATRERLKRLLLQQQKEHHRSMIFTPHVGELARLQGMSVQETAQHVLETAKKTAAEYSCVVVAKDARTMVVDYKSQCVFCNTAGNSGMATAGSGDVLTGMIAALTAQGMSGFQSGCVGVYIHAAAGDRAAAEKGEYAVMARDLIGQLKKGTWE